MALTSWTDRQILNQLDSGYKWSGSTITYSFATSSTGIYTGGGEGGFSALTAAGQASAQLALQLWDDLITPTFTQVSSGTSYTSSNIEFGMGTSGIGYAHAYYPSVGSVWFNATYGSTSGGNNLVAPVVGQHGFVSYIHEIGHALGLDHMGDYNGSQTSGPSSYQDSTVYSVMSYYGPSWGTGTSNGEGLVAWADWVGLDGKRYSPQTPMLNDIMAIQAKYGVDTTTRVDDTVYGFNSTISGATGAVYDFTRNGNPILTIFDSAGNDTLDLSGWSTSSIIDLAPGGFSSCNGMTHNIAIAYSCEVENAVGGAGDDTISGNALANSLHGGAGRDTLFGLEGDDWLYGGIGNDVIDGGGDVDYFVFEASWNAVSFSYDAVSLVVTISGVATGNDQIRNVEYFTDVNNVTHALSDLTGGEPPPLASTFSIEAVADSSVEGNEEGGRLQFKVTLSAASGQEETVDWTLAFGTGNVAADAADFAGATTGTLHFAAGETQATIDLWIAGDTLAEGDETFSVVLSNPSNASGLLTASAAGLIVNDDGTTLTGTAKGETLRGTDAGDSISGLGGNDTLYGFDGNDLLDGGDGTDNMTGGKGHDIYVVNSSRDKVRESFDEGNDSVKTTLSALTLGANVENLVFTGMPGTAFRGTGNSSANIIIGGNGNDLINGGLGSDKLFGKDGKDAFLFTTSLSAANVDTLADFNAADDSIRLENSVFKAFGRKTGMLSEAAFNIGSSASDNDDRVIFDTDTGALYYDSDGSGIAAAEQFGVIDLSGLTGALSHTNFYIV